MEKVNISDFRANLLKNLEKAKSGQQIGVTSKGKLLATISAPFQLEEGAAEEFAAEAKAVKAKAVKAKAVTAKPAK